MFAGRVRGVVVRRGAVVQSSGKGGGEMAKGEGISVLAP